MNLNQCNKEIHRSLVKSTDWRTKVADLFYPCCCGFLF